jgi:hypothetical protein
LTTRQQQQRQQQQKLNGEDDSLEDEDEDDDFAFSKEAKRADKAAEVFVYQAGSLPQDFIDRNLEDIGSFYLPPPIHSSPFVTHPLVSCPLLPLYSEGDLRHFRY